MRIEVYIARQHMGIEFCPSVDPPVPLIIIIFVY